jgi:DNA repair protein RecN (Recombination protein N)
MLGGERLSGTTLAHAQELLTVAAETPSPSPAPGTRGRKRS